MSSGITTRVEGLPGVQTALQRRGAAITPALGQAGALARRLLIQELARYPSERAGQTYQRTQALGRGWQRATPIATSKSAGFTLSNPVAHAGLVQGDRQAWMHVGRWKPVGTIVAEHRAEIIALFREQAAKAVQ